MSKTPLLILLLFSLSILLIESKPQSPRIEIKNHPKEYYDDLVEKGLRADNLTKGHPSYPFYQKMDYKADKKRRKEILKDFQKKENLRSLSNEQQTLENLGFIGLIQDESNKVMKFVTNNIKKEDSRFILYPYPFLYNTTVQDGGFFTLNQSALKGQSFKYLENMTSVQIGKAKGVYDIDIAILSMVYKKSGMEVDLFTEASDYCNYFVTRIQKTTTCLEGKNPYLEYKQQNPNRGAIVRVSAVDILNETLFDSNNQLKFKLLIIPDYLTGNEETIFSSNYLTEEAVEVIKKFRDLGGNIITSGKSGYLLERMELIPSGTYDKNYLLQTSAQEGKNTIEGCENLYKENPEQQPDFFKQLFCLGYKTRTILSATYKVNQVPENFESLIKYTNKELKLNYKQNDQIYDIRDENAKYDYILVSNESNDGKGRIFLINGNPVGNTYYFDNVRNIILYSMTKNFIYDLKIKFSSGEESDEDLPIPAGEEGVQLAASYKFYNLYETPISDFRLEILFAHKIELVQIPGECELKHETLPKYEESNLGEVFNISQYLLCQSNNIEILNSIGNGFKLEITDYTITQKLFDIPLMYSSLSFKMDNKEYVLNPGIFYAQAALAALLRGTINKDPSSSYPMEGKGLYFDLVLTVENKENTIAKDVNYIAQVPLVCPLVDGEDEGLVAQVLPVFDKYYFKHQFDYPWLSIENRSVDYIDYAEVAGKNVSYVNDYDTPVKISQNQRTDESVNYVNKFVLPNNDNIVLDEKAGATRGISKNTLLRQLYFVDAEKFYETAAPRLSLFINPATEVGAEAYYGGNFDEIPEDDRNPDDPHRAKVHLAFIRVDTFFYSSIFNQYQIPKGLDSSVLISLDRFDQSNAPIEGELLGEVRSKIQNKGHYDWTKGPYNTLKPNEYRNPLRQYKTIKQYDPTKPEDLKALQDLTLENDTIKLSHYMSPNKIDLITRAGNIYGFVEETGSKDGYLQEYPSVKFLYAHSIEIILPPEITRLGGYAEITLPSDVRFTENDPIELERITTSADNVAFFKYEYDKDNGIVRLYFRRGLMPNENYGPPSKCETYFEKINKAENFTVSFRIFELKYDFSSPTLETYYLVSDSKELTAEYKSFFSYPCVTLQNKLSRKSEFAEEDSHDMLEYELMNPFARYGGYFQELTKHTTVFGTGEAHHVKDPGFQGISGGFSLIANIGTSAIPFAEFLNHAELAIPAAVSTTRLEWTDIWGRKWAQSLRSCFPDIPPVPPAPLSYIMTTTFELITDTKNPKDQERLIEWPSDESVYIRVQMKMRNTYNLYWEPTLCLANQRPYIKDSAGDMRVPIFYENDTETVAPTIGNRYDVNLGASAVYGVCYDENSYMNGTKLTSDTVKHIKNMITCAQTLDAEALTNCSKQATNLGLPYVKRRPDTITDEQDTTPDDNWNYSPLIEDYLPDGYISSNKMWQLDLWDYYDDQFWKGYPFHMDDCIPNLDNEIRKPHDIIAFPIFKGLGYNLTYDRNYSLYKFPEYKGWWSDQLQNKDYSLLAGQQRVSQVSVGQEPLIKDSDWINGYDLKQKAEPNYRIANRMKNIYVCEYNRHRIKVTPGQKKFAFLGNVYQNNVVPILPDLKDNDERLWNYPCDNNKPQYSIYNISQVDNRVYTGNDRDWLYFAAGLRSNAMEDINVILKLQPLESTKFEGITKVQDGGRFTYWVPPDGPNSYLYYDGNINTVISKRVDLTILGTAIPTTINTFNTYLYELFEIEDEKELNRAYTMSTYMNTHGYGDAATMVYVGGIDATTCRVEPGTYTFVKIVFYNNAGFDWKMKPGAIELNETAYKVFLNANSINTNEVTAVQYPSKYNFMKPEIPPEIRDYVTLTPSQHVMDVSPQFFDLTFNNILTIKDALEGDYFYCLNVSKNFPKELEGKFWEIKMTLDESYFETIPCPEDVTHIHDYHLTIPSIRFGVPISEGENKGKIFWNLGQGKNMVYTFRLYKEFEIKGIKIVNEDIINRIGEAAGDKIHKYDLLKKIWDEIPSNEDIINNIVNTTVPDKDTFYNLHTIDISKAFPLLPYEVAPNKPYENKISLLIQSYSPHSPYGYKNLMTSTKLKYNDGRKNKTSAASPSYLNIYSEGPHFSPSFSHKIAELNETSMEYEISENQEIYNGDNLIIKLTLTASNEGTANAYNPKFNLKVNKDAEYIELNQTTSALSIKEMETTGDDKLINIFYQGQIEAGGKIKFDLYFKVQFGEIKEEQEKVNIGRYLQESNSNDKVALVKEFDISLCLTSTLCQEGDPNYGKQITDLKHNLSYKKNIIREIGKISLDAKNIGTESYPQYNLTATVSDYDPNHNLNDVVYVFYRKIEGIDTDYKVIKRSSLPYYIDEPFADSDLKDIKKYKVTYKVIGQFPDGRTLDSSVDNANVFEDDYELVEKDKEKGGFPVYAIAIIVVLGLAAIVGSAFLAYKFLAKKSVVETIAVGVSENPKVVSYPAQDFQRVAPSSPRGRKRRIQNKSVITVESAAN